MQQTQDILAIGAPSQRVHRQVRTYSKPLVNHSPGAVLTATVRFDDHCRNGHNTFSITAEVTTTKSRAHGTFEAEGCLHGEVAAAFPELAPLIKWHLVTTHGPMHYVANTMYWLGRRGYCDGKPGSPPDLAHARASAAWPDLPARYLTGMPVANKTIERALTARLPKLIAEFRSAIESVGFVW